MSAASRRRLQRLAAQVCASFDADVMRAKYLAERDKRLERRPEGQAQFGVLRDLALKDERFARMLADPHSVVRQGDPVIDDVEVCVIGAGFGGLAAGARLREAGVEGRDIRLVDSAGDVGGTWYWNRYPGAMCDVESYIYMPLCEETGYVPREKYSHQPELLEHSQRIARHYSLYEKILLGTQVTHLRWDECAARWTVYTDYGDAFRARFIVMNFCTLSQPKLPGVPGLLDFKGHMFHTSRWDYDYTGGSTAGNLTKLADKRVAIVGTGATAVQIVPQVGAHAKQLYVVQRTPSTIAERNNRPTTPEYAQKYLSKPGWQADRVNNFLLMTQTTGIGIEDLVDDGWTEIMHNLEHKVRQQRAELFKKGDIKAAKEMTKLMELADFEHMEKLRARCDSVISDRATAEALKPYYRLFCKRPCFHDEYLPTFNRPAVQLLDTDGKGLDAITEHGIVVLGQEYKVDCIILATGFETGLSAHELGPKKLGYDIEGRDGVMLSDKWKNGPRTLNGLNTAGFPNLWMQSAPQYVFGNNFVQPLEEAARHAASCIGYMREKGIRTASPSYDAEARYCQEVYDKSIGGQKFFTNCTPGYYNNEGQPRTEKHLNGANPRGPVKVYSMLAKMRAECRMFDGFDLVYF